MAKKNERKNEFRKNRVTGHPTYIYAKSGDDYKYIGITHAKVTDGIKNIPLTKNPIPKDSRQSYVRPIAEKKNRSTFGKKLNGGFSQMRTKKKSTKQKSEDATTETEFVYRPRQPR